MRHQYRVTKYDPSLRARDGTFKKSEWTSRSDVGRIFEGAPLPESEYLKVEAAYLFAVRMFLTEAKVEVLQLGSLECNSGSKLPRFVKPQAALTIPQCVEFARLALREVAWGKLAVPGRAYVHFGYDFYMYLGLPSRCHSAIAKVQGRGLFVESFRSPYLRQRPNPSVKGTSCGKPQSAPYVER